MAFGVKSVDLSRPQAEPRWVIFAVIGIAILIGAFMIAQWVVGQVSARVGTVAPSLGVGSSSGSSDFGEVL